jgi:hypothetical protein
MTKMLKEDKHKANDEIITLANDVWVEWFFGVHFIIVLWGISDFQKKKFQKYSEVFQYMK